MFIKDGKNGPRELSAEITSTRESFEWGLEWFKPSLARAGGMTVQGLCWLWHERDERRGKFHEILGAAALSPPPSLAPPTTPPAASHPSSAAGGAGKRGGIFQPG